MNLSDLLVISLGMFIVLATFALICLVVIRKTNQPDAVDMESVPCTAGCGTSLLVAKGAVIAGVTVTCLKCWTEQQHPKQEPQDVCENCECAMPEGCRGELWAEPSCRLNGAKAQGGE